MTMFVVGCGGGVDGEFSMSSDPDRPSPGHPATPPNLSKPTPEKGPTASGSGAGYTLAPDFEPVAPQSLICGDNVPGVDEECDSGKANDFCTVGCRSRDTLVIPSTPSALDGEAPQFALQALPKPASSVQSLNLAQTSVVEGGRYLGEGPHPVAADDDGFAVVFADLETEPRVRIALYEPDGDRLATHTLGVPEEFVTFANPVVAALPDQKYAVAWTAFNGDDDELGVMLQLVDIEQGPIGTPVLANTTTLASQFDPDILWTGTELVVVWTDDSDLGTGPDVRGRTFDANLTPTSDETALAATDAVEGDVTLAPYVNGFAAAWRSGDLTGQEKIVVSLNGISTYMTPAIAPGAAGDRPVMAQFGAAKLLVAFTQGTDPLNTGVLDTSRLRYAIVTSGGSSTLTVNTLDQMVAPYSTDTSIAQSQPGLLKTADSIYLTWRTSSIPGDALQEEVWIKRLSWTGFPLSLNLTRVERPLPISELNRPADQRQPHLALAPRYPQDAIIAVWEDYGENLFGALSPDVATYMRGQVTDVCADYAQQNAAPFAVGMPTPPDGTAANPYTICTVGQLQTLNDTASLQTKNFVLGADLDLSTLTGRIATFTGTFDGQGHTLANRTMLRTDSDVGFIDILQGDGVADGVTDGVLKNLVLVNPVIQGAWNVGAAVGTVYGTSAKIENVKVEGGSVTATGSRVGGVAGHVIAPLSDCSSSASVTSAESQVGGVAGAVVSPASVLRCSATGNVTATAGTDVGGLVGINSGTITTASATGKVTGSTRVGGLVGGHYGTITDSFARGAVSGNNAGGLIGQSEAGSSITRAYASGSIAAGTNVGALTGFSNGTTTYAGTFWNTTTHPGMQAIGNQPTPPAGIFAKTDTEMKTRATYLAQSWDFFSVWAIYDGDDYPIHFFGDYEYCWNVPQQNTPPFSVGFSSDGTAAKPYPLCTKAQMQHVANTSSLWTKQFRLMGDIDLTGMTGTIGNAATAFSGVFDGNGHRLKNFSLTATSWYAALFPVVNNTNGGTIKNLTLENFNVTGVGFVAALVGLQSSGTIDNVLNLDTNIHMDGVDGNAVYAGGLVGRSVGTISNCNSLGSVSAAFYRYVGGLVGRLDTAGVVSNSATSGSVTMSATNPDMTAQEVGGLVGRLEGQIIDSHSSAVVQTNRNYAGGLVAVQAAGSLIQNSYATGSISSTAQVNGGLVGQANGSVVDSWASGDVDGGRYAGGLVGNVPTGSSISNCYAQGDVLANDPNGTAGGLVGQIVGTSFIADSRAFGDVVATGHYAGGLVGRSDTGPEIRDSYATGSVSAAGERAGGLLGAATSGTAVYTNVLRSYATGSVSGTYYSGGLVGLGTYVNVTESWATGDVNQIGGYTAGGLVGFLYNASSITNSYARGNVASLDFGGGLVGEINNTATITNSYSAGAVTGSGTKGGLFGWRGSTNTCTGLLYNTTANAGLNAIGGGTTTPTGITGATATQLKQQATYTAQGWNFTTIWTIQEGVSYAELQ